MTIGIDMMGGDYAPLEAVRGIRMYQLSGGTEVKLMLFGDEAQINPLLDQENIPATHVQIVHTSQVIGMHEHPTKALKEKQDSSIAVGFGALAKHKIDAFISAGNTGAMLVGAMFSIKVIEGVLRPTISTVIP